jgi:hypothetical protein
VVRKPSKKNGPELINLIFAETPDTNPLSKAIMQEFQPGLQQINII